MAIKEIALPDLGTTNPVDVIEIMVQPGNAIHVGDTLLTLEGDKATMEIPASDTGIVKTVKVKVGDKVSTGSIIFTLEAAATEPEQAPAKSAAAPVTPAPTQTTSTATADKVKPVAAVVQQQSQDIYAGPGVRRFARELGVDLTQLQGTGIKNRITKDDVQNFVKNTLTQGGISRAGHGLPAAPVVDFAKFGPIETVALNKIKKLTGENLSRNWLLIPHVTQFNEADITELEEFRKAEQANAEKQGAKLTMLVFLMKAVVAALKQFPEFNASLDASGSQLILKRYFHIGVAVDTPDGLVVPVIRDVDQKGIFSLAKELAEISAKARAKGLTAAEMQGSCFTISSLGGIGGTAFTPIVNLPDVAILGVSKAVIKPVYEHNQFIPRLMLPLSLSYDHRVIDGAAGARFVVYLAHLLSDLRRLLF